MNKKKKEKKRKKLITKEINANKKNAIKLF